MAIQKEKFRVTGMTCSACSSHVEKSVSKMDGVSSVAVNLLANTMQVDYDDTKTNTNEIVRAVVGAGYGAESMRKPDRQPQGGQAAPVISAVEENERHMKFRIILSVCFMIPLLYIAMGHMLGLPLPSFFHGTHNALAFSFTQFLLSLPIVIVNGSYYTTGFKSLFHGAPNMNSLIAIGSGAAMVYGIFAIYRIGYGLGYGDTMVVDMYTMNLYFESAAVILTLITLGKYLESRAKGKTSSAISRLVSLAPPVATVIRDGLESEIPIEEVHVGDRIVVRTGQSVPVDGVVMTGSASIDESAITGESIPVEKSTGDEVISASISRSGYIELEAKKVGNDTTLAQIIRLVEEASSGKAPIAKLADKVSGIFVPIVLAIAAVTAAVWLLLGNTAEQALSSAVTVLVISCPCALGLATPVAIMVGVGKGAQNGILFRSAEALEIAHLADTVLMDKTGTLTEGTPRVTDIIIGSSITQDRLLQLAASIEKPSSHPLADSIVNEAQNKGLALLPAGDFVSEAGKGIEAVIENRRYIAGNAKMLQEKNIPAGDWLSRGGALATEGKTPLYFADETEILGIIAVADTAKPSSANAVKTLLSMGLDVVMVTGDHSITAKALQKQLGIPHVIADVLPQDKERVVRELQEQGKKVIMVGDGINDAPALTRADVGIAIGAGTDIAIESADIVLMRNDLLGAVSAIQLSKSVLRNIKENLFWAFFYNVLGIPLAAGVFYPLFGWQLTPMFGAAAMSLSSIFVVTNALRLRRFKPRYAEKPVESCPVILKEEKKGDKPMQKTIEIEGMSCGHCSGRVEAALNGIKGVSAVVDLEKKTAFVKLTEDVSDEVLTQAVTDAGYTVTAIRQVN
ncbi:MAG: heavy metal translocating P-type ATPase [Christensenellales bacterium]